MSLSPSPLPDAKETAVATLHQALLDVREMINGATAASALSCTVKFHNPDLCKLVKKTCDAQGYETSEIESSCSGMVFSFKLRWVQSIVELAQPKEDTCSAEAARIAQIFFRDLCQPGCAAIHQDYPGPEMHNKLVTYAAELKMVVWVCAEHGSRCIVYNRSNMFAKCLSLARFISEQFQWRPAVTYIFSRHDERDLVIKMLELTNVRVSCIGTATIGGDTITFIQEEEKSK